VRAAEQRDAADEGWLDARGSAIVGSAIVLEGKVVRPSQLIASVGWTREEEEEAHEPPAIRSPSHPPGCATVS
jgi:hypothetical protein